MAFDPFTAEVLADPYPHYSWLREDAPCYHETGRDVWLLSRYDDVAWALRAPELFSSHEGVTLARAEVPAMIGADGPDHTRLRRAVTRVFTPRAASRLTPDVESLVGSLLGGLLGAGRLDLVGDLARPLATGVLGLLMGASPAERADFARWSDEMGDSLLSPRDAAHGQAESSRAELVRHVTAAVRARRSGAEGSGADLLTELCRPAPGGDELTEHEIASFCVLLMVAGRTVIDLVGNAALALLAWPAEWARVVADPALVPSLVEEALRYDAPIPAFLRTATRDVELHGATIPRHGRVMLLFASANRDPARYRDPDRFDAGRRRADHLAFGGGPHACLGASLARLQAAVLARAFIQRVRSVEPDGEVVRTVTPLMRGVRRLPVRLHPR